MHGFLNYACRSFSCIKCIVLYSDMTEGGSETAGFMFLYYLSSFLFLLHLLVSALCFAAVSPILSLSLLSQLSLTLPLSVLCLLLRQWSMDSPTSPAL